MINLSAIIRFHGLRDPDRVALVYEDLKISYGDFLDRVERAASLLSARGIGEGDVVAVFMKNSPAFLEICFATSHLGAVFLPINYRLSRGECAYIIANSDAVVLFADAEFALVVDGLAPTVVLAGEEQRDLRKLSHGLPTAPKAAVRTPQDLFRLMYTSGTTDRPKGVMHSYENFYWKCMEHIIVLGLSSEDRLLVVGPLYHVGAFDLPGVAVLWIGGSIVLHRQFDEETALASIGREAITGAWLAPMMLGRMFGVQGRDRFDLSSLRWCIGGGERTPESRVIDFTKLFPRARYIDSFGMTETCSGDTFMVAGMELQKIGSVGRATPHVEIHIRDEQGNTQPVGIDGEICIRGPKVTKGYWKDPDKTANSFFGDWFRSGDIGRLDEDGFITITGRQKDMIISGGENIASSEIERVIYQLAGVQDCTVVGLPDQKWGERPVAVVVPRDGSAVDVESVIAICSANLARFKVPRDVYLVADLPRNASGKIIKREVLARLTSELSDS